MPGSLIQLETQGIETQLHINPTTARHVRLQELPPGFTDSIHIVTHGHAAASRVLEVPLRLIRLKEINRFRLRGATIERTVLSRLVYQQLIVFPQ